MSLTIDYLNHASVIVSVADVRLLCDPWFEGTAFSGGWGLTYRNADALDLAAGATHLWISHWHSDHLHVPTLESLARRAPDIAVIANDSANFSMPDRLRAIGFRNVEPFEEKVPMALGDEGVTARRFPTTGIDNMLAIEGGGYRVLNYNDCNLPERALRRLVRRIGPFDVALTNYNHAAKLYDRHAPETVKRGLLQNLSTTVDTIGAALTIPFASSHRYRSEYSQDQNRSLLTFEDLENAIGNDPRYALLRIGDRIVVDPARTGAHRFVRRDPPLVREAADTHTYGESVDVDDLLEAARARCATLARNFFRLTPWVPPLRVALADLDRTVELRVGREPAETHEVADIRTHSRALYDWLGRKFGDDTFLLGAHFELVADDTRAIRRWALATLLEANRLDFRSVAGFLATARGRRFLFNRSEEALATLLSGRVRAGQPRI